MNRSLGWQTVPRDPFPQREARLPPASVTVEHTAGTVAAGAPGRAAPRHLPPRGAIHHRWRRRLRRKGGRRAPGDPRVPAAARPHASGHPVRRAHRSHHRPLLHRWGTTRTDHPHPPPAVLTAVPVPVPFRCASGDRHAAARCPRRPVGTAAPGGIPLGRHLAVERVVPTRRRGLRGLSSRRRDRRVP